MRFPLRLSFLASLACGVLLTACDAADSSTDAAAAADALTVNEDAAVVVANALALDAGGALDAAAQAASEGDLDAARLSDPGCTASRLFDEATFVWTVSSSCERGDADGRFYAQYSRTRTFAFADAGGQPVADPENAATANVVLVDGSGVRRSPRSEHTLDGLSGTLALSGLNDGDGLVTTSGVYRRASTDVMRHRAATRTVRSTLDLQLGELVGPATRRADWRRSVSGTLSGTVSGEVTFDGPRGYAERTFERAFTVTFGDDGGERVARIAIGDAVFLADVETGMLRSLE